MGYYQQRWTQVLAASVRLAWLGFGMDWVRTVRGVWLMLRAIQLWTPFPGDDPDGARARMRQLYALVKVRYGEPADPEPAAVLEIDWWRLHRERERSPDSAETSDELAESVTDSPLLPLEHAALVRAYAPLPAAVHYDKRHR